MNDIQYKIDKLFDELEETILYKDYVKIKKQLQEDKDIKQIEYMDVIKRQYEESHAYCHYCREYFHKDDLYEVFIFLACKDCYKEASQIDYSQFCE